MRREENLLTNFPSFHGDWATSTMFSLCCCKTYRTDLEVRKFLHKLYVGNAYIVFQWINAAFRNHSYQFLVFLHLYMMFWNLQNIRIFEVNSNWMNGVECFKMQKKKKIIEMLTLILRLYNRANISFMPKPIITSIVNFIHLHHIS